MIWWHLIVSLIDVRHTGGVTPLSALKRYASVLLCHHIGSPVGTLVAGVCRYQENRRHRKKVLEPADQRCVTITSNLSNFEVCFPNQNYVVQLQNAVLYSQYIPIGLVFAVVNPWIFYLFHSYLSKF